MSNITINLLAQNVENAVEINKILENNCLIGLLCKDYTDDKIKEEIIKYNKHINGNVSLGLGAGNPVYGERIVNLASEVNVKHINQVLTLCGQTKSNVKNRETIVNGLISPSGEIGTVIINTGPNSSSYKPVKVDTETAVVMAKEIGADSLKFYPMKGLKHIDEFKELCEFAAKYDMIVEPTGGIDLSNFEEICKVAVESGVKRIIPHVYSSIIDENGRTKSDDVMVLKNIISAIK